jgi:hypothetical protein
MQLSTSAKYETQQDTEELKHAVLLTVKTAVTRTMNRGSSYRLSMTYNYICCSDIFCIFGYFIGLSLKCQHLNAHQIKSLLLRYLDAVTRASSCVARSH